MKSYCLSFNNYLNELSKNNISNENVKDKDIAIIQICGVEDSEMFFKLEETENVLSLSFDDADEVSDGVYPMTEEQADKIVSFIKKNSDKRNLIVHCKAGQSRSGGVAKFVSELKKEEDRYFYYRNPKAKPNRRIVRMLFESYYA